MEDMGVGEQRGASLLLASSTRKAVVGVWAQIIEDGLDFKKKVAEVLEETDFAESRAAKMDINDLLK